MRTLGRVLMAWVVGLAAPRSFEADPHFDAPPPIRLICATRARMFDGGLTTGSLPWDRICPMVACPKLPLGAVVRITVGPRSALALVVDRGLWEDGAEAELATVLAFELRVLHQPRYEATIEVIGMQPMNLWRSTLASLPLSAD